MKISLLNVKQAQQRISPLVKKTRISLSKTFSQRLGINLFLKWENEQKIKSFKIRGSLNKILSLTKQEQKQGLIASSAGNHAQGVALAAQYLNLKARIVMMKQASKVKIDATKKLGAELILAGENYDESQRHAKKIQGNSIFIPPFSDPHIIAGNGTIALELLEDLPDLDSVVVSVGGGGLLAGVSLALKTLKPSIKVYGVAWEGTPDFYKNFFIKKYPQNPLDKTLDSRIFPEINGLTDGIAVKTSCPKVCDFCTHYVDDLVCVSDKDLASCIRDIYHQENISLEGAGVAGLAGLLKYSKTWDLGKNSCAIISGACIDPQVLKKLLKSPR